MTIFRQATKQAVREIIETQGVASKFGTLLGEESLEQITDRVVDLFEMTLALRARVDQGTKEPTGPVPPDHEHALHRARRNAPVQPREEVFGRAQVAPASTVQPELRLSRTGTVSLTGEERFSLGKAGAL